MTQPTRPYSARDSIAAALRAYQSAVEVHRQRLERANTDRQRTSAKTQQARDSTIVQVHAARDRGKQQAQQMVAEAEETVRQANLLLHKVDLDTLMATPVKKPMPAASGSNLLAEIQNQLRVAKATYPQLERTIADLKRHRGKFLSRLRRFLRLPL